jgi:diguanylate cyclase
MKPSGLFLDSRVARRIFAALLCAATLPLALFAGLAWQGSERHQQAQRERVEGAELQHVGLRVFDRLQTAQGALHGWVAAGLTPQTASSAAAATASLGDFAPIEEVVHWPDVARPGNGAASPPIGWVERWIAQHRGAGESAGRGLWWIVPDRDAGAPDSAVALLVVGLRDAQDQGWWLARVRSAWLWDDFQPGGPAETLCVRAADGAAVHCAASASAAAPGAGFRIFLGARFGAPDWLVQAPADAGARAVWLPWNSLHAVLGQPLLLALTATVLLTTVLTLVIVRRTLGPLDQLSNSTRRLAQGELATRIHLERNDEFGELGQAFNEMADRVQRQWQARDVQAAIDRALLEGRPIMQVMSIVQDRLTALVPDGQAGLAIQHARRCPWQVVPASAPSADVATLPLAATEDLDTLGPRALGSWVDRATLPSALQRGLGDPARGGPRVCLLPVQWDRPCRALLWLALHTDLPPDDETHREVLDLRDRVGVALTAAARDQALRDAAVTDALTGLSNRAGLLQVGRRLLHEHPDGCGVLFIDLDGFKSVNDQHGHAVGDALLCEVASRLRDVVPADALLARPGGDEFVIVLPGAPGRAETLAAALCERLADPLSLQAQTLWLGASIGLACSPEHGPDIDRLMRRADLAMYDAKAAGRGTWRRFAAPLENVASERAWLRRELDAALQARALDVAYQPRVDLQTGRLCGVEALARWTHPQRGVIAPSAFIPVAEESGRIGELGRCVLDAALQQRRRWHDQGLPAGRLAVNVSALQLRDPGFCGEVLASLALHGLAPDDLELELTESVFAGDVEAICQRLGPLRERGVVVALDDFGTGYASLAALHRLPVDVMKIDRSFVVDLGRRASAEAVVRSVIVLAKALGKRVVAEGIETAAQREALLALGCDEGQGWLFAAPMPAEALGRHASRTMAG